MNWKKLMAVTMALCMAVPSGIPQTIMGAEFTQKSVSLTMEWGMTAMRLKQKI